MTKNDCHNCEHFPPSDWGVLDANELQELGHNKVCQTYQAGDVLFHQGDECQGLYCIVDGMVGVRKSDANGNSVLLRPLVVSGGIVGFRPLCAGENHRGSAEALRDTKVCFVPASTVQNLMQNNPQLTRCFLTRLAKALGDEEEDFFETAVLSVRTRLFHILLGFKDRYGRLDEDGTLHIDLPVSRQDLAAMFGVRPESLSRTVRRIEQDGIASFSGHNVQIHDVDRLFEGLYSHNE